LHIESPAISLVRWPVRVPTCRAGPLGVAGLPDDLSERVRDFSGRGWVLRRIADWLDHEESSLFLLTGEPGTGKSALAARLLQISQGHAEDGPTDLAQTVALAWFCQYSKTLTLDPIEFISALSGRLASISPVFLDALADAEANTEIRIDVKQVVDVAEAGATVTGVVIQVSGGISRRAAFARLILKPLQALLDTGWRQRFVVLVDAVDESVGYFPGDGLAASSPTPVANFPFDSSSHRDRTFGSQTSWAPLSLTSAGTNRTGSPTCSNTPAAG
jgi:hypothetical protein